MCDYGMSFLASQQIIAVERDLLAAMDALRTAQQRLLLLKDDSSLTPLDRGTAHVAGTRCGNLFVGAETVLASLGDLLGQAGEVEARAEMTFCCVG